MALFFSPFCIFIMIKTFINFQLNPYKNQVNTTLSKNICSFMVHKTDALASTFIAHTYIYTIVEIKPSTCVSSPLPINYILNTH